MMSKLAHFQKIIIFTFSKSFKTVYDLFESDKKMTELLLFEVNCVICTDVWLYKYVL